MKNLLIITFTLFLFASCAKDEVIIYPVAPQSGISYCEYEITKINKTTTTLKVGAQICIPCKDPQGTCPKYKHFRYGAYEMDVKSLGSCTDCTNGSYFDVGGEI